MKKLVGILVAFMVSMNSVSAFAGNLSERYIYINPNENILTCKESGKGSENINFDSKSSFLGSDGTMYVIFDSIGYFTANENIDFIYDSQKGIGYTQYKYPEHAPENWLDIKVYKNSDEIEYNGQEISIGKDAVELNGEIYLPLRSALLALGFDEDSIDYNAESKSAYITPQPSGSGFYFNNQLPNYEVIENIFYDKNSNDFLQIEQYIKENINKDFNLNDFTVNEYHSDFNGKDIGTIFFNYMIDDIRTDFAYKITVVDNKVEGISQIGYDIIGIRPLIDRNFLDEETLFEMAREVEGEYKNFSEQKSYIYFDSKLEKIVYVVDSVIGTDDSGYSTSRCYFVDNRDGQM